MATSTRRKFIFGTLGVLGQWTAAETHSVGQYTDGGGGEDWDKTSQNNL